MARVCSHGIPVGFESLVATTAAILESAEGLQDVRIFWLPFEALFEQRRRFIAPSQLLVDARSSDPAPPVVRVERAAPKDRIES